MKITLKDNVVAEIEKGTTVLKVAENISESLARNAICGKIDGKLVDLNTVITKNCKLEIITSKDEDGLAVLRHTTSHILAQAVKSIYPNAKLAIGPAINDGFYYDFDFKTNITPEDLAKIENEMKKIIKADFKIERKEVSKEQALRFAEENNEPYKVELVEAVKKGETISMYTQGDFSDICAGPHMRSTGQVKAFKLTKLAGAYWRGDEKNKMLTRIYGTAFFKQSEMDAYFKMIEEAEKRDHRKLGPALDLFMFDSTAQGMPYWLPKGLKMYNTLIDFWRDVHEEYGYQEVSSPVINNVSLWKRSGHWDHYRDDMFIVSNEPDENGEASYAVKPMNCPNAMVVYKSKVRSYRDLPLRISDCDILHRYEKTGTLHGLLRARTFRQDDSHNFITLDMVESEFNHLFELADRFYKVFGIKYNAVLSTRPESYLGDKAVWDKAETILKKILNTKFGEGNYKVDEGGGAFYGPKIDLKMYDALGREWQTGTFQLDMQLPSRFNLTYTDKDGERKTPVVIHRVIYGSLERFIGILIEHFGGQFPFWFSPVQVGIVTVNEKCMPFAEKLHKFLRSIRIRSDLNKDEGTMGNKIKSYQLSKVPYMLIIGEKEITTNTVSVRFLDGKQVQGVPVDKFIASLNKLNESKSIELIKDFN